MKKIVDFGEYIKEYIKYPHGGTLGGEHKKPIKDDDFDKLSKNTQITSSAYNIEREKNDERKINLFGSTLKEYNEKYFVDKLIDTVDYYKKSKEKYVYTSIKDYLNTIPESVIEHFNIDKNTDEGVLDFIENKFDLFKRSYEMWKEIDKKYPGERYGK